MTRQRAPRQASPDSRPSATVTSSGVRSAVQRQAHDILKLQRAVGNQAVQRRFEARRGPDAAGDGGVDIVDSRVDLVRVDSVEGKPSLKQRKVTYKEEKKSVTTGVGATQSNLTIEYALDESGEVRVGAIRPEYVITIYTPTVTRERFVREFGPIMDKLWTECDGDVMAFSKLSAVQRFNYEPQTKRHEEMHVASRQLALRDKVPDYLGYMKKEGLFSKGVATFVHQTNLYFRSAWDARVEEIVAHEQIYFIDAMAMVEEYRARASEEEDPWFAAVAKAKSFLGFSEE